MPKISAYSEQTDPDNDDLFVIVRAGVNYKIKLATMLEYTPGTPGDWGSPEPATIFEALDALAAAASTGLPPDGAYGQITVSSSGTVWNVTEATLAALAATAWTANAIPIGTGADTLSQTLIGANEFPARSSAGNLVAKPITDFAFTLLDDSNQTDAQTTLGLLIGSNVQAYDADLTTLAGLTATTDNFIQSVSNAWASRTPAQAAVGLQGTGLDVDACGFRGIPQNSQSGNYTTVAADAGKHIIHASGAGAGDTFTIDSNANVAYELGTAITFVNMDSNALSIAITSDTMNLAGAGTTGTRSLAQYGIATAVKVASTTWLISGTNLT